MSQRTCPRCSRTSVSAARFCAHCGLALGGPDGVPAAGRTRHPQPLAVPDGYEPIRDAADLYWRSESAWGGQRLTGTENIAVLLYNTGYPLCDVELAVRGADDQDRTVFDVVKTVGDLGRGGPVSLEIASYEIPSSPRSLDVRLLSACFSPVD